MRLFRLNWNVNLQLINYLAKEIVDKVLSLFAKYFILSKLVLFVLFKTSGAYRSRTDDLLHAMQAL